MGIFFYSSHKSFCSSGHVLCSSCCHKIIEKTLPRLQPACPFCRDHFTSDDVRLIRIEFSSSGWATPRRRGGLTDGLDTLDRSPSRIGERFPFVEPGFGRTRAEARRLEDKVAKVAAKKCSVEEVSTLHKELQDWLTHDEKPNEQVIFLLSQNFTVPLISNAQLSSLALSAALLRAILMNHFAHSEATKMAKGVEATLKGKLDDMELTVTKQEADLKQYVIFHRKIYLADSLPTDKYVMLGQFYSMHAHIFYSKPSIPKKYKNVKLFEQSLVAILLSLLHLQPHLPAPVPPLQPD
jgi:hypothetical protein